MAYLDPKATHSVSESGYYPFLESETSHEKSTISFAPIQIWRKSKPHPLPSNQTLSPQISFLHPELKMQPHMYTSLTVDMGRRWESRKGRRFLALPPKLPVTDGILHNVFLQGTSKSSMRKLISECEREGKKLKSKVRVLGAKGVDIANGNLSVTDRSCPRTELFGNMATFQNFCNP